MASYSKTLTEEMGVLDRRSWNDMILTWDNYTGTWDSYGNIPILSYLTRIRTLIETLTLTEAIAKIKVYVRTLTDSIAHTLSAIRTTGKVFLNSITHTETFSRIVTFIRTLTDSITHTESFSRIATFIRTLTDSITHTEALAKKIVRTLSDLIAYTETFIKALVRTLTETITYIAENDYILIKGRELTDALTHTDMLIKSLVRQLSETLGLTETFSRISTNIRNFTETLNIGEFDWTWDKMTLTWDDYTEQWDYYRNSLWVRIITLKTMSDTLNLADSILKKGIKVLVETITQTETIRRVIKLLRTDVILLGENFYSRANLALVFQDTIHLTESFIKRLFQQFVKAVGTIRSMEIIGRTNLIEFTGSKIIGGAKGMYFKGKIKAQDIIGKIKHL